MSHGVFIIIRIDSSTTVAEAYDKVIKKTNLIDPTNYYLYFCIHCNYLFYILLRPMLVVGNAERCLTNDNEKVCDLITKAEHLSFDNSVSIQTRFLFPVLFSSVIPLRQVYVTILSGKAPLLECEFGRDIYPIPSSLKISLLISFLLLFFFYFL